MPPTLYRNVLSTAQHKMSASIGQIRDSVPHSGETGNLVERVFRNQLLEVLPEKVGVSNGFVVDSQGSVSRQMDIILGSIRELYVFVIECLERQGVGSWTSGVSRRGFRRRAG